MKAKYKIGSLVKYESSGVDTAVSTIITLMISSDGVEYRMADGETVNETRIVAAYREIKPGKPRQKKPKDEAAKPKK